MDQGPEATAANTIVISGVGCAVGMPCPSERYLKTPKNRKFMGKQDHLAVCAAGRALEQMLLFLLGEFGRRSEPALEAVSGDAK